MVKFNLINNQEEAKPQLSFQIEFLATPVVNATGRYLHYFLMTKNHHLLQRNTLVYDLLIDSGRCYGVRAMVNYRP